MSVPAALACSVMSLLTVSGIYKDKLRFLLFQCIVFQRHYRDATDAMLGAWNRLSQWGNVFTHKQIQIRTRLELLEKVMQYFMKWFRNIGYKNKDDNIYKKGSTKEKPKYIFSFHDMFFCRMAGWGTEQKNLYNGCYLERCLLIRKKVIIFNGSWENHISPKLLKLIYY